MRITFSSQFIPYAVKQANLTDWAANNKPLAGALLGAAGGVGVQGLRRLFSASTDEDDQPSYLNGALAGGLLGALGGASMPGVRPQHTPAEVQKPLTPSQINEILSGQLALTEAHHTYKTHISKGQFAPNIKTLGYAYDKGGGGTVMVPSVWEASDAVPKPTTLHGYTYTSVPVSHGKEGAAIVARAAQGPAYVTWLKDFKGGLIGATATPTWELPASHTDKLLKLLRGSPTGAELSQFNPDLISGARALNNFKVP